LLSNEAYVRLSDITALAGAVSAVAVVVSLLLLHRQLRQAHNYQRALIQQGRAGRSVEIAMRLVSTDFAEAYRSCMSGETQVPETQLVQFIGYCRAVFLGAEDSFLQHREGLLDEAAFNSFNRSLHSLFESPGMRATWSILREWYDVEFATYMDGVVRDATDRPIGIQHAQWKTTVSGFNGTNSSGLSSKTSETRNAA
jgi:hypothetical protein